MKSKAIYTAVIAGFLLAGCTPNPFDKKTTHETAQMITQASTDAMKRMGYHSPNLGDRYAHCMTQRTSAVFNCSTLYETMAQVLNERGIKIKSAHLSNAAFFTRIQEDLKQISLFSL